MRFDVECVREFLKANRYVYTVRGYLYRHGSISYVHGVGYVQRFRVGEIKCMDDLRDYVSASGFNAIEEWWKQIEVFCKNKRKWLYHVKVIK